MRDLLTEIDVGALAAGVQYSITMQQHTLADALQAAARLGAERAMQATDGDLPAMLAKLDRLRDWYGIGPAQRAELDTLVAWVRERAREKVARVCEKKVWRRHRQWDDTVEDVRASWSTRTGEECAAAIRRGEG